MTIGSYPIVSRAKTITAACSGFTQTRSNDRSSRRQLSRPTGPDRLDLGHVPLAKSPAAPRHVQLDVVIRLRHIGGNLMQTQPLAFIVSGQHADATFLVGILLRVAIEVKPPPLRNLRFPVLAQATGDRDILPVSGTVQHHDDVIVEALAPTVLEFPGEASDVSAELRVKIFLKPRKMRLYLMN